MPVARGLGMGFDPPVISSHLPQTAAGERLEPGMVLAVTGYVWEQGIGAVFGMMGLIAALGAVVCWLFSEETSGQTLEARSPTTG